MKKRKKPFLPEASPKIWRSNKRTTSELHQTIWHFLQVLTHCNYHQFHKSPAPHWMAHHAKWKMILGQSDHLLPRARNIETHFVIFLEIYFILTELDKTNKNVASLISLLRCVLGSFIGKLFIDLKYLYFFFLIFHEAHQPMAMFLII